MDNWNNEQKPDVSVNGQFSGNPYQDQNQNTYDQSVYSRPSGGADGYNQARNSQPSGGAGNYTQAPNVAGGYNGQANGNTNYGQPFANYSQAPYQGPGYVPTEMEEPVGVGEWTGLLALASFIPCIGIILVLVWAFGGTEKKSKSNFCKAFLIIWLIKLALSALLFIVWGASIAAAISEF